MLKKSLVRMLLLGALLSGGTASAEEFSLRFLPAPGAKLQVAQVIDQSTTINMPQMGSQEMRSSMRMESTQTVLSPADSGASRVEFVSDRMAMLMKRGDVEMMNLDTDREEGSDDPTAATLGAMVGKAYVLEIDELGGLVGTEGMAEMLDEVLAAAGNPQTQAIMQQALSEESILQTMQMAMPVFPEEAVSVGDAWGRQFEMNIPLLGTVRVDATYTVEGLAESGDEPCVRLGAVMQMEFELDSPALQQMAAASGSESEIKMDIDDMDAAGWMCIARSDGVTLDSEVETRFAMKLAISSEGVPPVEMEMLLDQVTRQTTAR